MTIQKSAPVVARAKLVHGGGHADIHVSFATFSDDIFLTEREAGQVLGFSPWTLRTWRLKEPGKGPRPTLVRSINKSAVRYRVGDIREWLNTLSSSAA
jgi:predicted DNA-binding transcriptional regulator AlpA